MDVENISLALPKTPIAFLLAISKIGILKSKKTFTFQISIWGGGDKYIS